MSEQWEPGQYGEAVLAPGWTVRGLWQDVTGSPFLAAAHVDYPAAEVAEFRPLVVLDLADPGATMDALRSVMATYSARMPEVDRLCDLADQIEAQITPPRPPEPTVPGACVLDGKEERWTLADPDDAHDAHGGLPWRNVGPTPRWAEWADIPGPVRVLWDGTDREVER